MIEVKVDDWCKDCGEFEPELIKDTTEFRDFFFEKIIVKTDTMIVCKHKDRCHCMAKYIENQIKEKQKSKTKEGVSDA